MSSAAESIDHDPRWRDSAWRSRLRRRLLQWFETNSRTLPWRQSRDPYRVWISEIMLQQTQVATVIPYFERFTESFPTVAELAAASEQEVLRHWEGLGYYRRARQMHAAAQKIVEEHDGEFPEVFADVLALPGIGRYTAGAILSISRDQRLPVVEANTLRLYSRLIGLRSPPTIAASQRVLWEFAESILPQRGSGHLNQAAMELGSLVCTPRSPTCTHCPLANGCVAREMGLQETIPGKVKKIQYEDRREVAVVVRDDKRFLVRQCQPGERWAGLWDFPRCEIAGDADASLVAADHLRDAFNQTIEPPQPLMRIKHAVTKYRITLEVLSAKLLDEPQPIDAPGTRWLTRGQIGKLPLSTTGRKIFLKL
ncbi:A/G-specific adenine glycosylase [Rosistilla oblonga]|uniref:A/G-specific adenine glycosylase n=1 Tax=Rosistilla oblonga TaxID=2527990 RepID=UPI00118B3310|nr:A/G-specific adenine glycosylase [Rosistilla oblonga]QDV13249.1 A/G-specific adenine glycosylase [Rosistilla oblonga]